jgi:hypothetical protein
LTPSLLATIIASAAQVWVRTRRQFLCRSQVPAFFLLRIPFWRGETASAITQQKKIKIHAPREIPESQVRGASKIAAPGVCQFWRRTHED